MKEIKIKESDIREIFIRSSGAGGQNVNKSSTCVYLKHIPSGIEVKCQKERSQYLNRRLARKILLQKLSKFYLEKERKERMLKEKIKRQKRTRSKKEKLKILENKRHHSERKRLRKKIKFEDF